MQNVACWMHSMTCLTTGDTSFTMTSRQSLKDCFIDFGIVQTYFLQATTKLDWSCPFFHRHDHAASSSVSTLLHHLTQPDS